MNCNVIKAILYNQYSGVFKEAYRNKKKTVMILKYQSLILSVISSVSYLISANCWFKADNLQLKTLYKILISFKILKTFH